MNALLERVGAHVVADWRESHRWWSVRMNAIGALLLPLLTMVPSMPAEVQAMFPTAVRAVLAGLWCAAAIAARLIKQRATAKPNG